MLGPRQGAINDLALLHGHAIGLEVGFVHPTGLFFVEIVLLQQVPKRANVVS